MTIKNTVSILAGICLAVAMTPVSSVASGDGGGIAGSPHDFTDDLDNGGNTVAELTGTDPWNSKRQEICRVCHVPHDHGSVRYGNQGILWNHEVTTKGSWTMYDTSHVALNWIDGTTESAPAGTSKLCLGCHDGVTAINYYDGKENSAVPPAPPTDPGAGYGGAPIMLQDRYEAGFVIGNTTGSLTNNHPISITYNDVADTQLFDLSLNKTMRSGDTVASLLVNNRVECSTCHDVHNRESVASTHLLRESTKASQGDASGLCFVCHDK